MPDVSQGQMTVIPANVVTQASGRSVLQRIGDGLRYVITGAGPEAWFGPLQPLQPMAPESVKGRQYDYPVGANLDTRPRGTEPVSFLQLRTLARSCDLLRLVIETRKDQMGTLEWQIRPRDLKARVAVEDAPTDPRIQEITDFLQYPDKSQTFDQWQRSLLEDLFVIDAPAIYRRRTKGGKMYSLDLIDGGTIKPLLDASGRPPMMPDPCFQQILKGIPAVDYNANELLYVPRNTSTQSPYGYSPVEQVLLTVNIAIRRSMHQLEYYRSGSQPDAFVGLPKEWTVDQIKAFDAWFNSLMSGDLANRRKIKFMPEFTYQETKPPLLKDDYDDYLTRVIAYAFSVSPQALIAMMNRATAGTAKASAIWEGLVPIMRWMESLITRIIHQDFGYTDLEFKYNDDLEQDQDLRDQIIDRKLKSGRITMDEARSMDGRPPYGGSAAKPMVFTSSGFVPIDPEERAKLAPPPISQNGGPEMDQEDGSTSNNGGPLKLPAPKVKKFKKTTRVNAAASAKRKTLKNAKLSLKETAKSALLAAARHAATVLTTHFTKAAGTKVVDDLDLSGLSVISSSTAAEVKAIVKEAGMSALARLGVASNDELVNQINEEAVTYAESRAAELVGGIEETTRTALRSLITDYLADASTVGDLTEAIEENFTFSEDRAAMIAETEIGNANSAGSLAGYKAAEEAGVKVMKSWSVTDGECCDACQENEDAGAIPLDDEFPSGDDAPLAHPNCRCVLLSVVETEESEEE